MSIWLSAITTYISALFICSVLLSPVAAQSSLDLKLSPSVGTAAAPVPQPARRAAANGYQIGPDDVISVTVYQEPDLSVNEVKVSHDGTISFPLLGSLRVAGLSPQQLNQLVTAKLADGYLKQPNVTVKVDRQQLYYIKGEVEAPGGYVLVEGLTVEKAIALAGGYTERAAKRDVTIVREPGTKVREASVSTPIRAGDVITIEESFF